MDRPPLDADALRAAVAPRWARIDVVEQTASTNADLLARRDLRDRTAVVAEHQTSGRGRFDRVWTSPPRAGLTFSVAVEPRVPVARWGWLPLLAGVALAEAVQASTGVPAALKWPNDLLAGPDGRKAAGILAQTAPDGDLVVIGIGLNVSTTRAELPVPTATSLVLEGAGTTDRATLLAAVLGRLDVRVAQWTDVRGDAEACGLAADYRRRCATIGARARVITADGAAREGLVTGIDADGRLLLEVDGAVHTVGAGDVEHLRPA